MGKTEVVVLVMKMASRTRMPVFRKKINWW